MSTQEASDVAQRAVIARAPNKVGDSLVTGSRTLVERASGVFVLLAFVLLFSLWIPNTFLTTTTLQQIIGDPAITLILSVGLLFTLASGQFDLSAAQLLGLSAIISGDLMTHAHIAPVLAVVMTLGLGVVVGTVNGVVVIFGVSSFIATLASSSVLLAFTEIVSKDNFIGPVPTGFQSIATSQPFGIPIVTIYAVVIAVLGWYVLEHTPVGRRLQATGASSEAARLAGVPTRQSILGSFLVTSVLASTAGILVAAKTGTVSATLGPPYLLPAFAACFLGATQFKRNRFNIWGTVLATYLLEVGVYGLQLASGQQWITDMFNGVALGGAVMIAVAVQKRRDARLRAASDRAVINHDRQTEQRN